MPTFFGLSEREQDSLVANLNHLPLEIRLPKRLEPIAVSALSRRLNRRLVWLQDGRHELARLHRLGFPIWPGDDEPLHTGLPSPEQLERTRLLTRSSSLPILIAQRGEDLALSPESWRSLHLVLETGAMLEPHELLRRLRDAGYAVGSAGSGGALRRGDTVTVGSPEGELRIEYFGDRIERLTETGEHVPRLAIPPIRTSGDARVSDYFDGVVTSSDETPGSTPSLRFSPGGVDLGLRTIPLFYRHRDRLETYVRERQAEGFTLTASGDSPEFQSLASELGLRLSSGPGDSGWIWPAARRIHLDQHDFDPAARATKTPKTLRLGNLEEGKLLVHRDYGIARFTELLDREIGDINRTYLRLEFAGSDRLYVPIEQLDRLTGYEGSPHPTLSKFGSGEWAAALARLKKVSADIALELLNRYAKRELGIGHAFPPRPEAEERFGRAFPHQLTPSQDRVLGEVLTDMASEKPMDRLVAGDVGFGKTEIAWRAAHRAILDGKQVALIAPTTILAEQHIATATKRFADESIQIAALSRFQTPAEQRRALEALRRGEAQLAIGTHRLLSRDVSFADLGLIIIDEEQRFGVEDKERLRRLYEHVDALTLSATPIPRTLELALGGIRPLSIVDTPPGGRQPVITQVAPGDDPTWRNAITPELERGGQVYVITPRIRRIPRLIERLKRLFPDLEVGIAHGRLSERELSQTMAQFASGELRLLVASTIVENGLDLPDANTMIIDEPALLGLAELYQLRGRIGRGAEQAYCYLLQPGERLAPQTAERINALVSAAATGGGLEVALQDLEIRGSGNILGREQHGDIMGVGLALYAELLEEAREEILAGRPLQTAEALIDLPLETALPPEIARNPTERIGLYRTIDAVEDLDQLDQLQRELTQRHGGFDAIDNLISIKRLKLRSLGTPVAGIREVTRPRATGGSRRYLTLTLERAPKPTEVKALQDLGAGWSEKGIELRLPLDLTDESSTIEALRALEVLAQLGLTEDGASE